MIFTERTITVRKGTSKINEPVILYRGDFEVEVRFTILDSKFIFSSGVNVIDNTQAAFAQLAILRPDGGNLFSDVVECDEGTVAFTITKAMINELQEVGLYSFQIRLFDSDRTSRVSIPPIEFGIEIREPIAAEDHANEVNQALVGYSIAKTSDLDLGPVGDTFNTDGEYNKTHWNTGDRITEGKLNKIEDALDVINTNERNDVNTLNRKISNNFNILDAAKPDISECVMKGYGKLSDFDEETRSAIMGMSSGSINAVLGKGNVHSDNIANGAVLAEHINGSAYRAIDGIRMYSQGSGHYEKATSLLLHYSIPQTTVTSVVFSASFIGLSENIDNVCIKVGLGGPADNLTRTSAKECPMGEYTPISCNKEYSVSTKDVYIHVWVESIVVDKPVDFAICNYELNINGSIIAAVPEFGSYNIDAKEYSITDYGCPAVLTGSSEMSKLNIRVEKLESDTRNIEMTNVYRTVNGTYETVDFSTGSISEFTNISNKIYANANKLTKDVYINCIEIPVSFQAEGTFRVNVYCIDENDILVSQSSISYTVTAADVTNKEAFIKLNNISLFIPEGGCLALQTNSSVAKIKYSKKTNIGIHELTIDGDKVTFSANKVSGEIEYKLYYSEKIPIDDDIEEKFVNHEELDAFVITGDKVICESEVAHSYIRDHERHTVSNRWYCNVHTFERDINIHKLELPVVVSVAGTATFEYTVIDAKMAVTSTGSFGCDVDSTDTTMLIFEDLDIALPKGGYLCLRWNNTDIRQTYSNNDYGMTIRSVDITETTGNFSQVIVGQLNFIIHYRYEDSVNGYIETTVGNMLDNLVTPNRLTGKKIVAIGDSMVQGHSISPDAGWLAMLANRNNMTYVNYGLNGRYMTNKVYNGKLGVVDSFEAMDDDADYIVVFAGTNDAGNGVIIGEDTSVDPAEFKGALNIICDGLLTKYPTKCIMFITPYFRDDRYPAYIEAIETICAKYSIPVFNNAKNGGICWSNAAQVEALTLNDTLHLNLYGLEYASYKYEAFLQTL